MTIGLIGLEENGFRFAQNLIRQKFTVVAFDQKDTNRKCAAEAGIVTTSSIQAVALHLPSPRIIWCMVAGAAKELVYLKLLELLTPGDIVVDDGSSNHIDSILFQKMFQEKNIQILKYSTLGNIGGIFNGLCITVEGNAATYQQCKPIFEVVCGANENQFLVLINCELKAF